MSAALASAGVAPSGFGAGERHGWSDRVCSATERILLGQAAGKILDAGGLPSSAALAVLPCWTWITPASCVGRKARARDGGTLLLPARTFYNSDPVLLLGEGEKHRAIWSYTGLGRSAGATLVLSTVRRTVVDLAGSGVNGNLPRSAEVTLLSRRQLKRRLTELLEAGKQSRWELLVSLERYVAHAVELAHNRVVAEVNDIEIGTQTVRIKLDYADLERITTRMTYGEAGSIEASHLYRLIAKIVAPGTLNRVDPLRYLTVNLRRDAEAVIRHSIGDPHVGPKVRKVARSMPGASPEQILAAYRDQYPADRLGPDRLSDALSLPDMAVVHYDHPSQFSDTGRYSVTADHADSVIENVDMSRAASRRMTADKRFAESAATETTSLGSIKATV